MTIDDIRTAAGNDMVTTRADVVTVDGEPVLTAFGLMVVRGPRSVITYDEIEVGDELPPLTVPIERLNLVRYAGASGDFNIIHWNERSQPRSACRT